MRVRLELLTVGRCRHPACMVTGRLEPGRVTFPALVGRMTHPSRGTVLFDTGYGAALERSADPVARWYRRLLPYRLAPGEACVHQLAAAGVPAEQVRAIVLSHLHPDHAGGLTDFPGAELYLSRAAFTALATTGFRRCGRLGLIRDLFPDDLAARLRPIEDCRAVSPGPGWGMFDRGADLFGDGSLIAVPLPGHAAGHLGLTLETEQGRTVLLAADAAWLSCCYRDLLEPLLPARAFLDDYRAYCSTLRGLHDLARCRPDIAIVPSHCQEAIQSLQRELHHESA